MRTHLLDSGDTVYIHQSDINAAMLCGQRPIQEHLPGSLPSFGEQLGFGILLHESISDIILENQTVTGVKSLGYLKDRFDNLIENDFQVASELVTSAEVGELFEELRYAIGAYTNLAKRYEGFNPEGHVAVEERMEVELGVLRDGRTVILRGAPDAVRKESIIDWKTSSRLWKPEKAQFSIQPVMYRHLVRSNYEFDPEQFVFAVYVRGKGEWQILSTERTDEEMQAGLETAWYYANGIYEQTLPATPIAVGSFPEKRGWYCSVKWCDQWNICPFKYLPDQVDESEVKTLRWKS